MEKLDTLLYRFDRWLITQDDRRRWFAYEPLGEHDIYTAREGTRTGPRKTRREVVQHLQMILRSEKRSTS